MEEMELDWLEPGQLRRIKRREYHQLGEWGAFDNESVELLRGLIVRKPVKGPRHEEAVQRALEFFMLGLKGRAHVRCGSPVSLCEDSESEPDVLVVPIGDYSRELPTRSIFVIEVSDSRVNFDRGFKARLYAEEGVPEYWLVDLQGQTLEIRDQPSKEGYLRTRVLRAGETAAPSAFPDLGIEVSRLLVAP